MTNLQQLEKSNQPIEIIELSEKECQFVEIFVATHNAAYSFRTVFDPDSPRTTVKHGIKGRQLLRAKNIRVHIDELRSQLNDFGKMSTADVFNMWATIATADVDELVGLRVGACRHCYGLDHKYQWTPAEFDAALTGYSNAVTRGDKNAEVPDVAGGLDYNATLPPVDTCPECWGEGAQRTVATDTSKLSPTAKLLYGGVKKTKFGIEIVVADKTKALENVSRMLGAFKDEGGGPSIVNNTQNNINLGPQDAAAIYEAQLRNPRA